MVKVAVVKKTRNTRDGMAHSYHHGDLRAALMTAALTLIDRHGVKGFSLKDAAKIAGVSIAAPYRHFTDKDALLRALQAEGFARFNASLLAAYQGASTAENKVLELGVAYVMFALQNPAHFQVMFGLPPGDEPMPTGSGPDGFDLLVEAVEVLLPKVGAEERMDRVIGCWSMVHGFALLELEGAFKIAVGKTEPEAQLRRTLALLFEGHLKHVG